MKSGTVRQFFPEFSPTPTGTTEGLIVSCFWFALHSGLCFLSWSQRRTQAGPHGEHRRILEVSRWVGFRVVLTCGCRGIQASLGRIQQGFDVSRRVPAVLLWSVVVVLVWWSGFFGGSEVFLLSRGVVSVRGRVCVLHSHDLELPALPKGDTVTNM